MGGVTAARQENSGATRREEILREEKWGRREGGLRLWLRRGRGFGRGSREFVFADAEPGLSAREIGFALVKALLVIAQAEAVVDEAATRGFEEGVSAVVFLPSRIEVLTTGNGRGLVFVIHCSLGRGCGDDRSGRERGNARRARRSLSNEAAEALLVSSQAGFFLLQQLDVGG